MDLARRELGDEALLVNARPATPETRYLGAYEVVFGIPPQAPLPAVPPPPQPVRRCCACSADCNAKAAHVVRERIFIHRGGPFFLECRGLVASYDAVTDAYTAANKTNNGDTLRGSPHTDVQLLMTYVLGTGHAARPFCRGV